MCASGCEVGGVVNSGQGRDAEVFANGNVIWLVCAVLRTRREGVSIAKHCSHNVYVFIHTKDLGAGISRLTKVVHDDGRDYPRVHT